MVHGVTESAEHVVAGMLAGSITAFLMSPLDVARTRLQLQQVILPPHLRATGPVSCLRRIYEQEGVKGYFRGYSSAAVAIPLFWSTYFGLYDVLKQKLAPLIEQRDGEVDTAGVRTAQGRASDARAALVHSMSAIGTAIVCDFITNPFWVVRTRLQSQGLHSLVASDHSGSRVKYRGLLHGMSHIARHEGVPALFKGLIASWLGASHVAVQFPLYEYLKKRLGQWEAELEDKQAGQAGAAATATGAQGQAGAGDRGRTQSRAEHRDGARAGERSPSPSPSRRSFAATAGAALHSGSVGSSRISTAVGAAAAGAGLLDDGDAPGYLGYGLHDDEQQHAAEADRRRRDRADHHHEVVAPEVPTMSGGTVDAEISQSDLTAEERAGKGTGRAAGATGAGQAAAGNRPQAHDQAHGQGHHGHGHHGHNHGPTCSTLTTLFAATVSKFCASAATYPHEVIRARLQDQRGFGGSGAAAGTAGAGSAAARAPHYRGVWDCARKIYAHEGMRGLYSGFSVNLLRALPATAVMFLSYEHSLGLLKEHEVLPRASAWVWGSSSGAAME